MATNKLKKNWAVIAADSNHKYIRSFTFPVDEANVFTIGEYLLSVGRVLDPKKFSNDDHMQISNETNISCAKIEISPGENKKMQMTLKGTDCIKVNDKDLAPDSTEDLKDSSIICIGPLTLNFKLIPAPDATAYKEIMSSLTCSICLRLLIDPVTTCCSHTFCRSCMRNVISTPAVQGNNFHAEYIQCPLCRQNCCSNFGLDLKHVDHDRLPYKVSKVVFDFVESRPLCADCGNSRWLVPASEYYDCRTCVKNRNDAKEFVVCLLCVIDGHKNHDVLSCKERSINASRRFIDKVAPLLENYAKLRGEETATKGKIVELKKLRKATRGGPPPPDLPDINQKIYDMIPQQFERIKNNFDDDVDLNFSLLHSTSVDPNLEKSDDGRYSRTRSPPQDAESDTESFSLPENSNKIIISELSSKKIELDTSQKHKKLPRPSASVTWQDRKIIVQERQSQVEEEHKLKIKLLLQKGENKQNIYNLKVEALKQEIEASKAKRRYYAASDYAKNCPERLPSSTYTVHRFNNAGSRIYQ